jgi:hypothetical protein
MNKETYDKLIEDLTDQLLETGPDAGPAAGPLKDMIAHSGPLKDIAQKHPLAAGAAIGNADEFLGLLNKLLGYHNFGSGENLNQGGEPDGGGTGKLNTGR